ncbi:anaerobic ribonucleoside-triphosphate reductase activating protein [Candidatus Saccharibacteria bacterium]|nr:anaerobic ribonucleoside-triphosphate reductase activating protein [Candidatus Saccharibacteria bacterium]
MPAKEDLDPSTVSRTRKAADGERTGRPQTWLCRPQLDIPDGYIRLSGDLEHDSIVNGPGLRAVLWTQGCRQHCPGCQNPETWDECATAGATVPIEKVKEELKKLKGQSGITFCGGEPMLQCKALLEIARFCKTELNWNVWSFTGLVYERIPRDGIEWEFIKELDALIDGPFILSQRDLTMKFRGSRNQRILHLKNGEIISQE